MRNLVLAAVLSVVTALLPSHAFARKKYNNGHGITSKAQSDAYWANTKRCSKLSAKVGPNDSFAGYANYDACLFDY